MTKRKLWKRGLALAMSATMAFSFMPIAGLDGILVAEADDVTTLTANAGELTYTGSAQNIASYEVIANNTLGYAVEDGAYNSDIDEVQEVKNLTGFTVVHEATTANITKTNAGTYTVYYIVDDTNASATASFEGAEVRHIEKNIAKATPTATAPTAIDSLTYDGSAKALVNAAGVPNNGTVYYGLSDSKDACNSTDVPEGTNAGDYTVYYYIAAEDNTNYNDSNLHGPVNVSIAKADGLAVSSVAVDNTARTLTITCATAGKYEYTFDGGTHWTDFTVTSDNLVKVINESAGFPTIATLQTNVKARGAETANYNAGTPQQADSAITTKPVALTTDNANQYYDIASDDSIVYDGTDQSDEIEALVTAKSSLAETKPSVGTISFKQGNTVVDEPITAGEYDLYMSLSNGEGGDYLIAPCDAVKIGTVEIHKATPTITVTATANGIYGTDDEITLVASSDSNESPLTFESNNEEVISAIDASTKKATVVGAGTATITVNQAESTNYEKAVEKTITVTISPKSISGSTIELDENSFVYTGRDIEPWVTVTDGTTELYEDYDYTVAYSNNTDKGTATVTINGIGNYTGSKSKTFTITAASFREDNPQGETGSYEEGKSSIYLNIIIPTQANGADSVTGETVEYNDNLLVKDLDYTLTYNNETKLATVTGINNYEGAITYRVSEAEAGATDISSTVTIQAATGSGVANVNTTNHVFDYCGEYIKLSGITLYNADEDTQNKLNNLVVDEDYYISYNNNYDAGTAKITISSISDKCYGSKTAEFTISRATNEWTKELTCANITTASKPAPSATPKFGYVDYTYCDTADGSFEDEVPDTVGKWYVKATVSESSNYTGLESEPVEFTISAPASNPSGTSSTSTSSGGSSTNSGNNSTTQTTTDAAGNKTTTTTTTDSAGNTTVSEVTTATDGSKTETTTTTKTDETTGAKTETVREVEKDANGNVTQTTEKSTVTQGDTTTTESKVTTDTSITTEKTVVTGDSTTTEKKVENRDGSSEETKTVVNSDGSSESKTEIKNADGSGEISATETKSNGASTSSTVTTDASGKATDISTSDTTADGKTTRAEYKVKSGKKVKLEKLSTEGKKLSIPKTIPAADGKTYKVTEIGKNAAKGNKSAKSAKIGKNITKIGDSAMSQCKNLTEVNIGKDVKQIGAKAFDGDSKLKNIKMSAKSITKIGQGAFGGINKKATIKLSGTKKQVARATKLIKNSGIAKTVKIKRV